MRHRLIHIHFGPIVILQDDLVIVKLLVVAAQQVGGRTNEGREGLMIHYLPAFE